MNNPAPITYPRTNCSSYMSSVLRRLINRGNISIWFDPKTQCYAQAQVQIRLRCTCGNSAKKECKALERTASEVYRAEWVIENSQTSRKFPLKKVVWLSSLKLGWSQDAPHQIKSLINRSYFYSFKSESYIRGCERKVEE